MSENVTLHNALIAIKKLKKLLKDKQILTEPIAIIGLSCRFPTAPNKNAFWNLLCEGKNTISNIPKSRWDLLEGSSEEFLKDSNHPYWGSFLENIEEFDAYYFGITPREARRMDPQQRLLLEVTHEAIEDAGIPIENLMGTNTGVFASLYASQYGHMQQLDSDLDALFIPTGNAISIAANRLSYLLNLQGPSLVVDTACSSSLVATHLACLNLQNKLCDIALVSAVNINLLPSINLLLSKAKMLSPDGQCYTFDAKANGYVPGEGVGSIVLKPLSKAIENKDRIYAIISNSAINQDGKTNGLTAPSGLQQEKLLKKIYNNENIKPEFVSYIECHGTGTLLGDPIEVDALGEAVGKKHREGHPCWIGSVKTNIGHLEPAAGIASIIKVALAIYHQKIPPHINFFNPNPHIAFDKYPFKIPTTIKDWSEASKIAGISGFGFGGTNAHLVLQNFLATEIENKSSENNNYEIFTLSAKDEVSLKKYITSWCEFIELNSTLNLSQICYHLHLRRSHYKYRVAIICKTINDLLIQLNKIKINFKNDDLPTDNPLTHLATQYLNHIPIRWEEIEKERKYDFIDLPFYPWNHQSYWCEFKKPTFAQKNQSNHPFNAKLISSPLEQQQFLFNFSVDAIPEIKDTFNMLHAGYYTEMLAFAAQQLNASSFYISDLAFLSPILISNDRAMQVQLILTPKSLDNYSFVFYKKLIQENKWIECVTGKLALQAEKKSDINNIKDFQSTGKIHIDSTKFYDRILNMTMPGNGSLRWTKNCWIKEHEILCEFAPPKLFTTNHLALNTHFSVIDACIQSAFLLLPEDIMFPFVASKIQSLSFYNTSFNQLYLKASLHDREPAWKHFTFDWVLCNENNEIIINCKNITMTCLKDKTIKSPLQAKKNLTLILNQDSLNKYLTNIISEIFSMPIEDINNNESLNTMGIDSLLSLVLIKTIEEDLGFNYPLQELMLGPSINQMTKRIYPNLEKKSSHENYTKWIAYHTPQKQPKRRLFCFPFGGAGASVFKDWQAHLPNSIEICPVQLPGREERLNEKPIDHILELINHLIDTLGNYLDVPFAFFGHSFGALISFKLAHELIKRDMPIPQHLFVSAFPDPRMPTRSLDKLLNQILNINIDIKLLENAAKIDQLTDSEIQKLSKIFNENSITNYGDHLLNREIIKILMPIFMADMKIVKSYQFMENNPLPIPISVFIGKNDHWILPQEQTSWKTHTSKSFEMYEFNGGHLFIKEKNIQKEVLFIIRSNLLFENSIETEMLDL